MLLIGEFSKLSHLTVKALRFYEREGLLKPASVDGWSSYRYCETSQLETAARLSRRDKKNMHASGSPEAPDACICFFSQIT